MRSFTAGSYRIVCQVLFLVLALSSISFSQGEPTDSAGIQELWNRQMEAFFNDASSPESAEAQKEIGRYLIKNGALRAPQISAAYVVLGRRAIANNRRKDAQWAFKTALEKDPHNIRAMNSIMANAWFLGFSEIFETIPVWFQTVYVRYNAPGNRHIVTGNFALILIYAFFIFGSLTAVIVALRQSRLFIHEILNIVPGISDPRFVGAALFIGLVALSATPAGIPGVMLTALTVGFVYGEKHQIRLLWFAWILVALTFPLSLLHIYPVQLENNSRYVLTRFALNGGFSEPVVNEVEMLLQDAPESAAARLYYIRGLLKKRGGFYNDARQDFERYQVLNPRDAGVYINLGNIEYINDLIPKAIEYYRKAESIEPHNPVIFFNLSKAYLSQFRFEDARAMQNRAIDLDASLVNRLNRLYGADLIRMVADAGIPVEWLKVESKGNWTSAADDLRNSWRIPFVNTSTRHASAWWVVLTLLFLFLRFLTRKHAFSRFCIKCGTAMKPDSEGVASDRICMSCYMVFFRRAGTGAGASLNKDKKSLSARRFWSRFIHIAASVFVPGSGRIFSGYIRSGSTLLILWSVTTGYVLASPVLIRTYLRIPYDSVTSPGWGVIVSLFVLHAVSIIWSFMEDDV